MIDTTPQPQHAAGTEHSSMPDAEECVHFRCRCGRSVATPPQSEAAESGRCSRCRERAAYRQGL